MSSPVMRHGHEKLGIVRTNVHLLRRTRVFDGCPLRDTDHKVMGIAIVNNRGAIWLHFKRRRLDRKSTKCELKHIVTCFCRGGRPVNLDRVVSTPLIGNRTNRANHKMLARSKPLYSNFGAPKGPPVPHLLG